MGLRPGSLWVAETRSWRAEQVRRSRSWVRCVAFCTGCSCRWRAWLCARDARKTLRSSCCATSSQSWAGRATGQRSPRRTGPYSAPSRRPCPDRSELAGSLHPTPCCAGIDAASPATGLNPPDQQAARPTTTRLTTRCPFDSSERPAAMASSTNTSMPPDQPRHDFGHPRAPTRLRYPAQYRGSCALVRTRTCDRGPRGSLGASRSAWSCRSARHRM